MDHFTQRLDQSLAYLESTKYFGNSLKAYLICLLTLLVGFIVIRVAKAKILKRLENWAARTVTTWDDMIVSLVRRNLTPVLYTIVVYFALKNLYLNGFADRVLHVTVTLVITWQAVQVVTTFLGELLKGYFGRNADTAGIDTQKNLTGVLTLVNLVVWSMASVLAMDNLGIKVSAFVAGLGITGIAVALAAQAVLGDLFAYFVILFDKPFEIGHFIIVGDAMGTVDHIGLKTTRLRSLSGEQIILSNKYLTDSQVKNYRRMDRRRVVFVFEVEYGTSAEVLRVIPEKVKQIITAIADATFDRCHFQLFADSGLRFETVYYAETPDYNKHMDILQEINLQLKTTVEDLGSGFAFPTRTLRMASPVRITSEADGMGRETENGG